MARRSRRYQGIKRTGKRRQRIGFDTRTPVFLLDATRFTDDPVMSNPDWVVQTLNVLTETGEIPASTFGPLSSVSGEGRRRMPGDFLKVACAYTASTETRMEKFWSNYGQNPLWAEAGFKPDRSRPEGHEHRPSYPTFHRRLVELEDEETLERLERATQHLIGVARKHVPEIGRDVGIDTTAFQTPSRLYHVCKPGQCPRAPRHAKRGETPTVVPGISAKDVEDRRHEEAKTEPAPTVDQEREERSRRRSWVWQDARGREWRYFRLKDGCLYRCRDTDAGIRKYDDDRAWTGGYELPAVDFATGLTLASVSFSASRREHAGVPALIRKLEQALDGDLPETIAADRGFSINKTYRFATRRGITLVAPWRKPNQNVTEREQERTVEYDEHGVPRCPGCGGPTYQHGQGLGLMFRRGEPFIAFKCMLATTNSCANRTFRIRCATNWRLLIGLSRESERYLAIRAAHKNLERAHSHRRKRFGVAGKDETGRLKRRGMSVHRLRGAISRFLEWLFLCLRHGWIGNHRYRNAVRIVSRNARPAWKRLRAQRTKSGLMLPYGPAAFALGLASSPEVFPPPDPPPESGSPPGSADDDIPF